MINICLYLHAHQPLRLRKFSLFDIGNSHQDYFDQKRNKKYLGRIAKKSYLPANKLFLDLINKTQSRFKISFSLSGVLLEQLEENAPKVIKSFQKLAKTKSCEFITETYYHSLASYFSEKEFKNQIYLQTKKIKQLFSYRPQIFRNTELLYFNNLAQIIYDLGYKAVLIEGADKILMGRRPNVVYRAKYVPELKLILKNYLLSDDIAFRFSNHDWQEFPLTADKFLSWVKTGQQGLVNLFMDYETLGEHQWAETGIFKFLEDFITKADNDPEIQFVLPSEIIMSEITEDALDIREPLTWADTERDLSAWLGNQLQKEAAYFLYALETKIKKTRNADLLRQWRYLQISDHFYYMCTKWFNDGDVHKYFNPYDSPYDAYINYMNVLRDLETRI